MSPGAASRLAALHERGALSVTSDLHPPRGTDFSAFRRGAEALEGLVDAVFVTESPGAVVRMGSLSGCIYLILETSLEPVLQMVCVRSNRIALQGELLGAAAWSVRNLLLLGGDSSRYGNDPRAQDVRCLDTPDLIRLACAMRDQGVLSDGAPFEGKAPFYIGAAVDPFGTPEERERTRRKLESGAEFLVTQPVFDVDAFATWCEETGSELGKARLIAGVLVLGSARAASRLSGRLPGMRIPEGILRRLEEAEDPVREGIEIAAETAAELSRIPRIAGIHFMNASGPENAAAAIRLSGLRT